MGHNWHVHVYPPEDDVECVDAIGGHYNPFNVSLGELWLTCSSCLLSDDWTCLASSQAIQITRLLILSVSTVITVQTAHHCTPSGS